MERLLELAKKQADAVTVYGTSYTADTVMFDNARLKSTDSSLNSGTALTVVKNGKQGFAFTRNLNDRDGLVRCGRGAGRRGRGVRRPAAAGQPADTGHRGRAGRRQLSARRRVPPDD
jgi:predicted Zn-dependent protease